jgi:hypothetical protein
MLVITRHLFHLKRVGLVGLLSEDTLPKTDEDSSRGFQVNNFTARKKVSGNIASKMDGIDTV